MNRTSLRAGVLGANDGILSTSGMLLGVVGAALSLHVILLAGLSTMIAGAFSMAVGEYNSVKSQRAAEDAAIAREAIEIDRNFEAEVEELKNIYISEGADGPTAGRAAREQMNQDALKIQVREDLGILDRTRARPILAAGSSAISFSLGALVPLLSTFFAQGHPVVIGVASIAGLGILGYTAAALGDAPKVPAMVRMVVLGSLAMLVTFVLGTLVVKF